MLFTWDTNNLCIIFRGWRVTGTLSLVLSILAVMALTAGYEAVREASRQYEQRHAEIMENAPRKYQVLEMLSWQPERLMCPFCKDNDERRSLLWAGSSAQAEEKKGKVIKAALYGVQVFYSFFIM